jgi:hypothetical protein
MRSLVACVVSPVLAGALFWMLFGACVADVPDEPEPVSRLLLSWDPLACGEPHRVVLQLEDEAGDPIKSSTPCWLGGIAVDLPRWGWYTATIYAWAEGVPMRSSRTIALAIDAPVVRWQVLTPQ